MKVSAWIGRCFVAALLLVVFLVPSRSIAAEKVITLKVSNWFPITHKQSILLDEWGKEVEKKTNGKLKVNYYPAGTLVPTAQSYDAVTKGITDVGNHVLGYTVGKFPLTEIVDLPLGYPNNTVPTRLANAFYNKFKPKEFDEVKILWFHAQAPGIVHTKDKSVTKLEDLKGLKMRTYGSNAQFMGLLGGTPVAMPMTDVYDALSRGVADGLMCPYEALEGFRIGEQVKYHIENYDTSYSATFVVAMNKKKWNSLPPDVQKVIDEMSVEYIEKFAAMWDEIQKSGKEYCIKRGSKVITLDKAEQAKWVAKAEPLFEDYAKRMKAKGLPGDEALKFVRDYLKPYKK
ncbi:MAG: TRAP transporter substrate-binding protein [Syntrophobacterales bacterium]|jgi:TRAP-type C4-dicarboxylate transport system substrate-binding protein|nr:TRAP transporter substrate-binding protein [Syntrophobacterales bacterium]